MGDVEMLFETFVGAVACCFFCYLFFSPCDGRQVLAACKLAKQEIIWYCQHSAQGSVRTLRFATIS